jgi:hypothetical protein
LNTFNTLRLKDGRVVSTVNFIPKHKSLKRAPGVLDRSNNTKRQREHTALVQGLKTIRRALVSDDVDTALLELEGLILKL